MVLTVTLNPAIDKMVMLRGYQIHALHRLKPGEQSMTLPGGKGVNIAMTLQLLGNQVVATGFAAGHTGHMLTDSIRNLGITTNFIFTEGTTRTNISILDVKHETLTEINEQGPDVSKEDQDYFLKNYIRLLHSAKMVVLGGSLPQNIKLEFYANLVFEARKKSVPVIAHVSSKYIEPILSEHPNVLVPDLRSKHRLEGKPVNVLQALHDLGGEFLQKSSKMDHVIFNNRIENVLAMDKNRAFVLKPENLKINNMLGYADAYVAGYAHGLLNGWEFKESLRFASACGLTNVEQVCKDLRDVQKINDNLSRISLEEYK